MTTPVPVGGSSTAPAAQQPVRPTPGARPGQPGYTHRTWLDEMAEVLGHLAGVYGDLRTMEATLHQVEAGRTQLALVTDCSATGLTLMRRGVGFVSDTDSRYVPVFNAIKQAGGVDEVAKDKHYHDRA